MVSTLDFGKLPDALLLKELKDLWKQIVVLDPGDKIRLDSLNHINYLEILKSTLYNSYSKLISLDEEILIQQGYADVLHYHKKRFKELSVKIQDAKNIKEKSLYEMALLHLLMTEYVIESKNTYPSTLHYSLGSIPTYLYKTNKYNCVGACIRTAYLLETAGIKYYFGSTIGHLLLIVELSDGKYIYVDPLKKFCFVVRYEIVNLSVHTKLLKLPIKGESMYNLIHPYSPVYVCHFILENFHSFMRIINGKVRDERMPIEDCVQYFHDYKNLLPANISFLKIQNMIAPHDYEFSNSNLYKTNEAFIRNRRPITFI